MSRASATSVLVSSLAAAAACAVVSGCGRQPLDIRTGAGGGGGTIGGGASGSGGAMGGTNRPICASIEQVGRRLPADILILLDASGSMDEDATSAACSGGCGASSKWALATAAINGIVSETEQSTNWGLKLFADGAGSNTCVLATGVAVPVAAANAGAIAAAIAGRTSANGGVSNGSRTPTRAAEIMATQYLASLATDHPKFILLVTDGEPNCTPGNPDQAADDSAGSITAVADARTLGIPTMVIGIATAGLPADATLSAMAVAGGYARVNASPAYYPVASAGELNAAGHTLIGTTPDCVFNIPPPPNGITSRLDIGVMVDGKDVPFDAGHTNGWDYTNANATSLQVYGPACDEYLTGMKTVTIVFYCGETR